MAPVVEFGHPTSFRAGDTVAWRISFADFPVSEAWVLSYALVSNGSADQAPLTWSSGFVTNDGNEYTVTLPASTTDDFAAGTYTLTAYLTLSGVRHSPYSASIQVTANTATQTTGQGLSLNRKILVQINALLEGRTVADVTSYSIAGRALNREPVVELLRLQRVYRTLCWNEEHPGASPPGSRLVTFW